MCAFTEANVCTRSYARVIGPYLAVVGIAALGRISDMPQILTDFFANSALVWSMGALLLLTGLFLISRHPFWSGAPAIAVSIFSWMVTLKGLGLLLMPQTYQEMANGYIEISLVMRLIFALLILCGLWLSYVGWLDKPKIPE